MLQVAKTGKPNLHDRTGRLEMALVQILALVQLHDRTGRLENLVLSLKFQLMLHDRTGRLEIWWAWR